MARSGDGGFPVYPIASLNMSSKSDEKSLGVADEAEPGDSEGGTLLPARSQNIVRYRLRCLGFTK